MLSKIWCNSSITETTVQKTEIIIHDFNVVNVEHKNEKKKFNKKTSRWEIIVKYHKWGCSAIFNGPPPSGATFYNPLRK